MSDDANVCLDCGTPLGTLEKLASILMSARRCFDCDLKYNEILGQQRRQEEERQEALEEQETQAKEALRKQALGWVLSGNLPAITTDLILKPNEICHFSTHAGLIREKVVGRKLRGRSQGVSVRITKRMNYRVGGSGGESSPIVDVVKVDSGNLYVTSQRCIFAGVRNTINMPHSKLVSFKPYSDGIQLNLEGKAGTNASTQVFGIARNGRAVSCRAKSSRRSETWGYKEYFKGAEIFVSIGRYHDKEHRRNISFSMHKHRHELFLQDFSIS